MPDTYDRHNAEAKTGADEGLPEEDVLSPEERVDPTVDPTFAAQTPTLGMSTLQATASPAVNPVVDQEVLRKMAD